MMSFLDRFIRTIVGPPRYYIKTKQGGVRITGPENFSVKLEEETINHFQILGNEAEITWELLQNIFQFNSTLVEQKTKKLEELGTMIIKSQQKNERYKALL